MTPFLAPDNPGSQVIEEPGLPRKSEKSVKIGKNQPINRPLIGGIGQWGEVLMALPGLES